jgi:hypothetical protein
MVLTSGHIYLHAAAGQTTRPGGPTGVAGCFTGLVLAFSVLDVCALWLVGMIVLWCGMHTWPSGAGHSRTLLGADNTEYREPSR